MLRNCSSSSLKYDVKRGLRNHDGTGVMAGVTLIGNVRGYVVQDGEKVPAPGQLFYRGINVEELIDGFTGADRFGFQNFFRSRSRILNN